MEDTSFGLTLKFVGPFQLMTFCDSWLYNITFVVRPGSMKIASFSRGNQNGMKRAQADIENW